MKSNMEYNGTLTLKVGATTNTLVLLPIDSLTGVALVESLGSLFLSLRKRILVINVLKKGIFPRLIHTLLSFINHA